MILVLERLKTLFLLYLGYLIWKPNSFPSLIKHQNISKIFSQLATGNMFPAILSFVFVALRRALGLNIFTSKFIWFVRLFQMFTLFSQFFCILISSFERFISTGNHIIHKNTQMYSFSHKDSNELSSISKS